MKIFSIIFLLIPFYIFGQKNENKIESNTEEIFVTPETSPNFPGGNYQFKNYLDKTLNIDLINSFDTTGIVVIIFTIDTSGKVTDLKIRKPLISEIDNELVRVFKIMPKWESGKFWDKKIEMEMNYVLNVPYK